MVDLNRSPAYTGHNIPLVPDHYYRGVIVDLYSGLWQVDSCGEEIMIGYGKGGSDRLSFQKAFPNNLYVNGIVKANTILVGNDVLPIESYESRTGYAFVGGLMRSQVESGDIPLRVYQRYPAEGKDSIAQVHEWHIIFDSFKAGQ